MPKSKALRLTLVSSVANDDGTSAYFISAWVSEVVQEFRRGMAEED
jgi:hypothetical protein